MWRIRSLGWCVFCECGEPSSVCSIIWESFWSRGSERVGRAMPPKLWGLSAVSECVVLTEGGEWIVAVVLGSNTEWIVASNERL